MKRLIILSLIIPAIGCMGLRPVGPITQGMFEPQNLPAKPGQASVSAPMAVPEIPAIGEGPKPPAPTFSVDADDVNASNARAAAAKLQQEIETDIRNADLIPNYPEVSKIQRR